MKRHLWRSSISLNSCPPWECTACTNGVLRLKVKSLNYEETEASKASHNEEGFDPDWIEYIFTAWAECSNENCKQTYAISGKGGLEPQYTGQVEWNYFETFYPNSIQPPLKIISTPANCPADVSGELKIAFELFWLDTEACASRIRIALEHLLSHLSIPKQKVDTDGKTIIVSLHKRIETYVQDEPVLGNQLMALKWLGNAGSHGSSISKTELLDAFEILEFTLSEILQGKSKRIAMLARKLAEKHSLKKSI